MHVLPVDWGRYKIPKRRKGQPAAALSPNAQLELVYVLRDLVHSHISSKHLSTAYASASETARTGSGDCTEHAVLLAALLKARGIPARVCHGLVYVEQGGSAISGEASADATESATVSADGTMASTDAAEGAVTTGQFGWHMWSQALVDGRWLDLDATLHVPFSVGHVLVGTSSMSDKEAHNNHMQMAALIGNLEVRRPQALHASAHAVASGRLFRPRCLAQSLLATHAHALEICVSRGDRVEICTIGAILRAHGLTPSVAVRVCSMVRAHRSTCST